MEVSGGCLSDFGYCLGGYDMQANDKHPIRLIFIGFFLFSQLPQIGQNVPYFGVSAGCLEGVWEVSGGCLAHSGLCLGHTNAKSIAISPVGIINLVYFIFFQWPILVSGRAARAKAINEIAPCSLCLLRFSKIVPSSGHYCQQKNSPRILLAHKSAKT